MGPKARSWPDLGQGCLCSYAVLSKRGRRERGIKYVGLSCRISIYLTFMMEGYLFVCSFCLFPFCFVSFLFCFCFVFVLSLFRFVLFCFLFFLFLF